MSEMTKTKMTLLKQMYRCVMDDDDAYSEWIELVPDEPDEDDLREICEDEKLWCEACSTFGRLVADYELNK